uniref:Protein kinase domain-containing protein n=1 Tax=Aegilops tauschii subsp. strangulata TaxID=200361 RepID=A0A452Z5K7_AEGTS
SHAARVIAAIDALSSAAREEMLDLVAASTRLARRVCGVYGAWMGPEAATLWLVSERHTPGVPPLLNERSDELETVARIGAVGMEVCEALMGLHGEGMVLGCLRLDCFRLDHFGRCLLDLNEVLALCRGVRAGVCLSMDGALVAPEMTAILRDATWMRSHDFDGLIGRNSDVWLLGCILVALVTGDERLAAGWNTDGSYDDWQKEVLARLDAALVGTQLEPLVATTALCLSYEPESRPEIADVWKCIRGSQMKPGADALAPADDIVAQKSFRCLLLGELSSMCSAQAAESDDIVQPSQDSDDKNSTPDDESNCGFSNGESVCTAGTDEPQRNGVFKSSTLLAHRDCVTGLAIGGINTIWPVYCVHNTLFHYSRHILSCHNLVQSCKTF